MRRKEERSKQGQTNSKAKQHSTSKAVTFPKMYMRIGIHVYCTCTCMRAGISHVCTCIYMYEGGRGRQIIIKKQVVIEIENKTNRPALITLTTHICSMMH